tara:strand:+ start:1593 stop:2462 length:870 start_codon:yes stop_codon:yes gene_type:complete
MVTFSAHTQNIALNSVLSEKITERFQEFFQSFKINFFVYLKFDDSLSYEMLYLDSDLLIKSLDNKMDHYYLTGDFSVYTKGYDSLLWSVVSLQHPILSFLEDNQISNGLTITHHKGNLVHRYHFGTDPRNINQSRLYCDQKSLFNIFTLRFLESYESLTQAKEMKPVWKFLHPHRTAGSLTIKESLAYQSLLKKMCDSDFRINFKGCSINLSRRQIELLSFLRQGKSVKMAAHEMAISARTAEGYLGRLREKFDVNSKEQLLEIFNAYPQLSDVATYYMMNCNTRIKKE